MKQSWVVVVYSQVVKRKLAAGQRLEAALVEVEASPGSAVADQTDPIANGLASRNLRPEGPATSGGDLSGLCANGRCLDDLFANDPPLRDLDAI